MRRPIDKNHPAEKYCRGIISGRIPACRLTRLACERHVRDLGDGYKRGLWFDPEEAQDHIDFFKFLRHSKGEFIGKTFELGPFQQFIVYCLFGWKRENGFRRFREAYIEVPRKNGKSTTAAGIALDLFVGDGEGGAEVYCVATMRDQALIVYEEAERMVAASPALSKRIEMYRNNMCIPGTASKFKPLGADSDTMDGLNVHGAIVDEYHAHKTSGVYDKIKTAVGARRQSLIFTITTAGTNRQSPCWKQHAYCEQILENIMQDDRLFAIIYTLDPEDDWKDPKNWSKSNPNLGVSVRIEELKENCITAQNKPSELNPYLRFYHNIWTEQETRWISIDQWNKCGPDKNTDAMKLRLETLERLEGRRCVAGLDLSSKVDLTCYMKLFYPTEEDPKWICIPEFYVPKENVEERVKMDRVGYDTWINQGFMNATPGNVIDYEFIEAKILEDKERYELEFVAFDPFNAVYLQTRLNSRGVAMVEFRQGFLSMSEPSKALETMVLSQKLEHLGNPVLTWNVSNMAISEDPAGNIKPDKSKRTEKIDGGVALIMAIGLTLSAPEGGSVYDKGGILTL